MGISLVRENTVALKPPRALWVPFELGRPLGVPNDPAFQSRVLKTALGLLESGDGPTLLVDYPEDAPKRGRADDESGWVCPVSFPPLDDDKTETLQALRAEIDTLAPWYDVAVRNNGRTLVGLCGLSIDKVALFLDNIAHGGNDNPVADTPLAKAVKRATEDLKAFYLEAVQAQPSDAESGDLYAWFWRDTQAGRLIRDIQKVCKTSDDEQLRYLGTQSLLPRAYSD